MSNIPGGSHFIYRKCYRMLKWIFPLLGFLGLITVGVCYLETFSMGWKPIGRMKKFEYEMKSHVIHAEKSTNYPCDRLLQTVHFNGSSHKTVAYDAGGCPLREFTSKEAVSCLKENSVTNVMFIGDSRVRQLFEYFWRKLADRMDIPMFKYHHNNTHKVENITVTLEWYVYSGGVANFSKQILKFRRKPDVILIGVGLWGSNTAKMSEIRLFERGLRAALLPLGDLAANYSTILWIPQDPIRPKTGIVTTELMDKYNAAAYNILNNTDITIWRSSRLTANHLYPDHYRDKYHFKSILDKYKSQILINWMCNRRKKKTKCCT